MRTASLGQGPIAIGVGGPGGSLPSPTASAGGGSYGRSPGDFMGSVKRRTQSDARQSQQRPVSGSSASGAARTSVGSPGQIAVATVPAAPAAT